MGLWNQSLDFFFRYEIWSEKFSFLIREIQFDCFFNNDKKIISHMQNNQHEKQTFQFRLN